MISVTTFCERCQERAEDPDYCTKNVPLRSLQQTSFFPFFISKLTCHTPTMALAMRMRRMTKGSTNAVTVSSPSSKKASTKEMMAARRRILTRRSSNCSSTSCQRDLPSSAGSSVGEKREWLSCKSFAFHYSSSERG